MSHIMGVLWKKQDKDGKPYLSGFLYDMRGDISIAIFQNERKDKENHPDYNIVISNGQKKDDTADDEAGF